MSSRVYIKFNEQESSREIRRISDDELLITVTNEEEARAPGLSALLRVKAETIIEKNPEMEGGVASD